MAASKLFVEFRLFICHHRHFRNPHALENISKKTLQGATPRHRLSHLQFQFSSRAILKLHLSQLLAPFSSHPPRRLDTDPPLALRLSGAFHVLFTRFHTVLDSSQPSHLAFFMALPSRSPLRREHELCCSLQISLDGAHRLPIHGHHHLMCMGYLSPRHVPCFHPHHRHRSSEPQQPFMDLRPLKNHHQQSQCSPVASCPAETTPPSIRPKFRHIPQRLGLDLQNGTLGPSRSSSQIGI